MFLYLVFSVWKKSRKVRNKPSTMMLASRRLKGDGMMLEVVDAGF